MHVVIAQVHENIFDEEADELSLPTTEGEITILKDHQPLVVTLKPGTAIVRKDGKIVQQVAVESGVLEVSNDQATVLL